MVTLQGELDVTQAEQLGRALAAAAICGARIIVDLAELTFMDCAGLSALVVAHQTAREADGDLVLAAVRQPVARLLYLTNRDRLLRIFAGVEEAASDPRHASAAGSLAPGQPGRETTSMSG